MYCCGPYGAWEEDTPGIEFERHLCELYEPGGKPASANLYPQGVLASMTMMEAVKRALEAVGYEKLNREAVKKYGYDTMTGAGAFDTEGLSGPVDFDPVYHKGLRSLRIWRIKDGKLQVITDWLPAPMIEIPPPSK